MTTPYQRGARFEYVVKKALQDQGYFVIRSAGSRSEVDLCGVKINTDSVTKVIFVQCKKSFMISKDEFYSLKSVSLFHGAIPIVTGKFKKIYYICISDLSYKSFLSDLSKFKKESLSKKKKSG